MELITNLVLIQIAGQLGVPDLWVIIMSILSFTYAMAELWRSNK